MNRLRRVTGHLAPLSHLHTAERTLHTMVASTSLNSLSASSSKRINASLRQFVGQPNWSLPTPCLLIDLKRFNDSVAAMVAHAAKYQKRIRPHTKSHKSAEIALRQIKAGCVGVCTAKISEAQALMEGGVKGILVTSPIATRQALITLQALIKQDPDLMVVTDSKSNADTLASVAKAVGKKLNVLVDVDGGHHRTGCLPKDGFELAKHILSASHSPHLRFKGVQCYLGHVQHITSFEERRKMSLEGMNKGASVVRQLRHANIECPIFTGSGTGTFDIDVEIPELTDMQVGSFCLMDAEYLAVGCPSDPKQFKLAGVSTEGKQRDARGPLTLLSTIVSASHHPQFVTCDAGLKAMYKDGPPPTVLDTPVSLQYSWWGDEHGKITVQSDGNGTSNSAPEQQKWINSKLVVGGQLEIIVSHCDPTVNLHDVFFITDRDTVVDIWSIDARGKCQ